MMKSPDGTTTSSTQSGQSRKTSPGLCASTACGAAGVGNAERHSAVRRRHPSCFRPRITAILGRTFLLPLLLCSALFKDRLKNLSGGKGQESYPFASRKQYSTVVERADSSVRPMGSGRSRNMVASSIYFCEYRSDLMVARLSVVFFNAFASVICCSRVRSPASVFIARGGVNRGCTAKL